MTKWQVMCSAKVINAAIVRHTIRLKPKNILSQGGSAKEKQQKKTKKQNTFILECI